MHKSVEDLTLELLIKEEKQLSEKLTTNRDLQFKMNSELYLRKYNLKIGDIIQWTDGKETKKGKLVSLSRNQTKVNYPNVALIKKDGKPGNRIVRIWNSDMESIKILPHE